VGKQIEQAKQPKLDTSFAAQGPQRKEVAAVMAALKLTSAPAAAPVPDDAQFGEHAWDQHQRNEAYKAELKKGDDRAGRDEQKRLEAEERQRRALELDARLNALRREIPAIMNSFRHFGTGACPEVLALINHALNDLNVDVVDAMQERGLDGAEALIVEHETKIVPALRERCGELQTRLMAEIAAERQAADAERVKNEARKLNPDQALQALEGAGLRLRVNAGEIEIAGQRGLDERELAILELHRPAIVAALESTRRLAQGGIKGARPKKTRQCLGDCHLNTATLLTRLAGAGSGPVHGTRRRMASSRSTAKR
jgi:hypothetical protein